MANIPMALVGAVVAIWLSDGILSVASMVGFVTLTGIAARNGILKVSHYINLVTLENEPFGRPMIVRGSLERLTPVLMTALVAALALVPLVAASGEPGKEILHPVAVVIFGGLMSSTLLDTIVTPVVFLLVGEKPLRRLVGGHERRALSSSGEENHAQSQNDHGGGGIEPGADSGFCPRADASATRGAGG